MNRRDQLAAAIGAGYKLPLAHEGGSLMRGMEVTSHVDESDPRYVIINGRRLARVIGAESNDDADDDNDDDDDDDDNDDQQQRQTQQRQKKDKKGQRQQSQSSDDDNDDDDSDDDDDDDSRQQRRGGDDLNSEERKEFNRLRREAAEAAKAAKQEERKRAAAEGRHQDIIAEVERERDEAYAERDEATEALEEFKQKITVQNVARRLHFHDAEAAFALLPEDDRSDEEDIVEAGLKRLAKKKPFLVDKKRRRQARIQDGREPKVDDKSIRSTLRGVLSGQGVQQQDEEYDED